MLHFFIILGVIILIISIISMIESYVDGSGCNYDADSWNVTYEKRLVDIAKERKELFADEIARKKERQALLIKEIEKKKTGISMDDL